MIRTVPFAEYEWYHSKLYCLQNAISYFCTWKLTEWHHFSNLVMEWLVNSYPGAQDSWTFSFPNSWEWKHVIPRPKWEWAMVQFSENYAPDNNKVSRSNVYSWSSRGWLCCLRPAKVTRRAGAALPRYRSLGDLRPVSSLTQATQRTQRKVLA